MWWEKQDYGLNKMKTTKKKSPKKKLEDKLYKLCCQIIHARGKCELCGKTNCKLDFHHIEGRKGQLLYLIENGILLCFQCHRLGVHAEASSVQAEFREKITALRGQETMDKLKRLRYDTRQPTLIDLETLMVFYMVLLKEKLNQLKDE